MKKTKTKTEYQKVQDIGRVGARLTQLAHEYELLCNLQDNDVLTLPPDTSKWEWAILGMAVDLDTAPMLKAVITLAGLDDEPHRRPKPTPDIRTGLGEAAGVTTAQLFICHSCGSFVEDVVANLCSDCYRNTQQKSGDLS